METSLSKTEKLNYQENFKTYNFFSTQAASLFETQIIGSNLGARIKDELTHLQSVKKTPLLTEMSSRNSTLLKVLEGHYEGIRLYQGLLCYTLRPHVASLIQTSSKLGESLLENAKIKFNRSCSWQEEQNQSHIKLYSQVIIDSTSHLEEVVQNLVKVYNQLDRHTPSNIVDLQVAPSKADHNVKEALGFNKFNETTLVRLSCQHQLQDLAWASEKLVSFLLSFSSYLQLVDKKNKLPSLVTNKNEIESSVKSFPQLRFDTHKDVEIFDKWRLKLCKQMKSLNDNFVELNTSILLELNTLQSNSSIKNPISYLNIKRKIISDLIKKDVYPKEAEQITNHLANYCQTNQVSPHELVTEELERISPHLTTSYLQFTCDFQGSNFPMGNADLKEKVLLKASAMSKKFKSCLASVAAFCAISTTSGCGVKRNPFSEVITPRPPIPFHEKVDTQGDSDSKIHDLNKKKDRK